MNATEVRPTARAARPLADLAALLGAFPLGGAALPAVTGVTHDSRAVRPGDLYAGLPGLHAHGAAFAADAARAGAVAVLTDPAGAAMISGLPVLVVPDPRASLGPAAAWFYGDPSASLALLGVTGTNGKTTVTYLLEAALAGAGHTTGMIGTIETRIARVAVRSVRTTPEATDLQALLATMVERGVTAAAMEVSSHALALHRVGGVHFAGAAFTNLSQDHLDFHPSMEAYFAAKASLFEPSRTRVAVIGTDDGWGRRLAAATPGALTYATDGPADWRASGVVQGPAGSTMLVTGPDGVRGHLTVALPGAFNARNALGAVALAVSSGCATFQQAADGIAGLSGVPGRMERVEAGQPYLALVDYAHTPDAVTTLLETVRPLVAGRVIVVLGCGGDRDRGKRPLMGAAAARGADVAFLTSDNPRSEDPAAIIDAMVDGVTSVAPALRGQVHVEPDRAAAIAAAVAAARPGDAVVVAGKGHETGQEAGGVVTPFDDRVVLRAAIGFAAGSGGT